MESAIKCSYLFSFVVLFILAGIFCRGYAMGNSHAHQVNFGYASSQLKSDPYLSLWYYNFATQEVIKEMERMDGITRLGYVYGFKNINSAIGKVIIGYQNNDKTMMKKGHYAIFRQIKGA